MAIRATSFLNAATSQTKSKGLGASSFLTTPPKAKQEPQQAPEQEREQNAGGFWGGLGYAFEKIGLGLMGAVEGIIDYTAGGLAKFFGADDWAEEQFANDWVNYNHADEWFNPDSGWKIVGDITQGIGNSIPSLAALTVVGAATGGAAIPAMITTFLTAGLSAAGNATKEAYKQTGELSGKEFGYGALVGGLEGTVETFSDAVLGGVGGQITKGFRALTGDVAATAARQTFGKTLAKSFLSEGFEEVIGELADPVFKRWTYDPTAENASLGELAYAGFVGGMSGLIMSAGGSAYSNARILHNGSKAVSNGRVNEILQNAQNIAAYETENHTDLEAFKFVSDTYASLQESMKKTNGNVETVRQKHLLGVLDMANTAAIFEPTIQSSARNIYANADAIAQRMTEFGYTDESGKPIVVTADQIREGIDAEHGKRAFKKSFEKALRTNSVLRTIAVLDATNKLLIDAKKFSDATLRGQKLASQVDLNRFFEATESEEGLKERAAVAQRLGIEDWNTLTAEELLGKIEEFAQDGGPEQYRAERADLQQVQSIAPEEAQNLPTSVVLEDGAAVRYSIGDSQIAVERRGDNYRVYEYESGLLAKNLTQTELDALVSEMHAEVAQRGAARYSLQTTEDGKQIVVIDTAQDIFDDVPRSQYGKTVREYMKKTFRGKIVEGVTFTRTSENEYTNSKDTRRTYSETPSNYDAKMRAGTELDNLVRTGEFIGHEEAKHERSFNKDGYNRYRVTFELNGKKFTGEMLVALSDGKSMFYDIVKIKESSSIANRLAPKALRRGDRTTSDNNIAQTSENVNALEEKDPQNLHDIMKIKEKSVTPISSQQNARLKGGDDTLLTDSIAQSSENVNALEGKSPQNLSADEIDTYARENIEGYNKLGGANQSMIRSIIRQGRAAGVEESFVLSCARVSAHSGLNIVFSKELCFVKEDGSFADGAIDLKKNRIIINPEAKGRSGEKILIHELTHAIYVDGDIITVADGVKSMSAEEKENIRKRYAKIGHGSAVEVSDEINAHFAEETLANQDILERLVAKKPTLKQKILGFFKGARADYASDAGLSGAAKRLYSQYSKLFEKFSENNAFSNASEGGVSIQKRGKRASATTASAVGARLALPHDIIQYSNEERASIESNSKFIVANSLTDVIEFYNSAVTGEENGKTTMFVGKFSTQTAAKVKKATGVSVFNKSIALNWSDLRHIKIKHGNANREALRGQISITSQNFSQIIDAIASPDNVRAEVDEKSGLTSIIFLKQSKGETTAVTILSEKKKALTLKSAWITKEKQRISPPSNAEALNTTSETLQSMNATSTNSIAKNSEMSTDSSRKSENKRFALDMSKKQDKTSAATSINSSKLPAVFNRVQFKRGTVNLDMGGGKFDNATEFLATQGVKNYIYDPYNRSEAHNRAAARATENGQSDTVTISNVLNVIDTLEGRQQVLANAVDALKPDGTAYITVYEGNGSGEARTTGADQFQLNRKLRDYLPEVRQFFDDVTVKNGVIIARSPIKTTSEQNSGKRYALSSTEDIRFALSEDGGMESRLSDAQWKKIVANHTRSKVFSRGDAQQIIDDVITDRLGLDEKYGNLRGKAKVVDVLFERLNEAPKAGETERSHRLGTAIDIADYIIENTYMTDIYAEEQASEAMTTLSALRGLMHRIDLSGIKDEILHRYDRKNTINLVWGAKVGGIAPDVAAQELESYGIRLDATNPADQFFEILDLYHEARARVDEARKKSLAEVMSNEELDEIRNSIEDDIMSSFRAKGSTSALARERARIAEESAERRRELVEKYKKIITDVRKSNKLTNSIIDTAQYLKDIATKRKYVGADVFSAPELTTWLQTLGRLKYRSDLRKTGARQILLDYGKFYNEKNPLLYDAGAVGEAQKNDNMVGDMGAKNYIDQNVIDALDFLRENEGSAKPLSTEELQAAQVIMLSAKHLFENYDQIIMEGRKVNLTEIATQGNELLQRSKNHTGVGVFNTLYGVMNKVIEPRVVIRSFEGYDPRGVLTRAYKAITDGETAAGLRYIELMKNFDSFLAEHKEYSKRLSSTYISVADAELSVGQAISLYELSKREQAQAGLYEAGFGYIDQRGAKRSARITESDIVTLEKQFTAEDRGFIDIVEDFFNVQSKQLKTEADMQILGYTNASDDFYFPIKRDKGTIARNITDARSLMSDWANVYNFSFNKDVRAGAKNKLFITGVYDVVTRHAKQLSTYAELTVPLKNFAQIYAKNIGSKTNAVSIASTLDEQVWGGADKYLSKLFKDIQGTATSNSVIEKLRGAYAKYQLGANLKVIVSQVTSYPTAGIYLDVRSMVRGAVMKTDYAALDKYCPYARVRNYERGIVRAEGVVDKVGKVGDILTKPIQWTDRLTIGKLWNACQVQIERDGGAKVGTQENMEKAGVLLEDVIRLTQPNYTNTERSELMRSESDIVRSFTMFTSVPLKQLSRFVESIGEYRALKQAIKSGNADADMQARYKQATKQLRRTLGAITIANVMYCLVGQFFKWLYDKDRKDKNGNEISFPQDFFNDFVSTSIGMFPVVKDIYNFFANDYEFNNFAYETVNNVLSASQELFDLATKAVGGEVTETSDYMRALRNSIYAIGQLTGLPFRNINNLVSGLIKRFDPATAYEYNSMFYNAQYSSDIKAALEKGDTQLAGTIMTLLLNERGANELSDSARAKMIELYEKGYDVLPRTVGDTITFNGEERTISAKERNTLTDAHKAASAEIDKVVVSQAFSKLSETAQAKTIKKIYNSSYEEALAGLFGVPVDDQFAIVAKAIGITKTAPVVAGATELTSEKINGKTVQGSRKKKVISYLQTQSMTDAERLLLLYYLGYKIGDREYKGMTTRTIQHLLAQYITQKKLTREEKTMLAEMCGLTVKNGRIYLTAA